MGYYSFIPFMECYHGIVNIHHEINGSLTINNMPVNFNKGYGYIEKDWGSSFPESWIWVQSNHFESGNVSFMFSIAKIPWFHTTFIGFISFIKINDKFLSFATYTGAKITTLQQDNKYLYITIMDKNYVLIFQAELSKVQGDLSAPVLGLMNRKIQESIDSIIDIKVYNLDGSLLYKGKGKNTGIEMAGNVKEFIIDSNTEEE